MNIASVNLFIKTWSNLVFQDSGLNQDGSLIVQDIVQFEWQMSRVSTNATLIEYSRLRCIFLSL